MGTLSDDIRSVMTSNAAARYDLNLALDLVCASRARRGTEPHLNLASFTRLWQRVRREMSPVRGQRPRIEPQRPACSPPRVVVRGQEASDADV